MLNKNSLGLLKKGAAKQSRIKSIAWHLRWLVRTRADLRPSGLVRPRTDIKLRPSAFVRTRTDFKLQKKRPNDNLKRFVCKLALVSVLVRSSQSNCLQLEIGPCSYECTWP